jgi:hypothetical protein
MSIWCRNYKKNQQPTWVVDSFYNASDSLIWKQAADKKSIIFLA